MLTIKEIKKAKNKEYLNALLLLGTLLELNSSLVFQMVSLEFMKLKLIKL